MPVRTARRAALLLALIVPFATPSQAQAQAKTKRNGGGGGKYALLVGVRRYNPNELRSLPYSEPDVVELADVLKAQGYKPGNVVVMTQTTGAEDPRFLPLAANIRAELKLLLADTEEDDSVLIALAGHGVQFRGQIENYFCPADARLADRSTLIPLTDVYKQLESCRAGLKLLLVDACRNDPQSDNSRSRSVVDLESTTRPQRTPTPGGVLAFFSCSETEKAFEHADLKHGVFFHYVIEGLRGAAVGPGEKEILIPDLEKYVKRNVRDFVREKYGVRQMPELRGTSRDLVPLVVRSTVSAPEPVAPKPPAVVIQDAPRAGTRKSVGTSTAFEKKTRGRNPASVASRNTANVSDPTPPDRTAVVRPDTDLDGPPVSESPSAVAERNKKAAAAFLNANLAKPGVSVLPSGLQYKVLKRYNGPRPGPSSTVTVHYRGTFLDGTEFDTSFGNRKPFTTPLNGVIAGWREALQLMNVGSKWQIFVPPDLAYGAKGNEKIPPNSVLIFEIDLLKVQ